MKCSLSPCLSLKVEVDSNRAPHALSCGAALFAKILVMYFFSGWKYCQKFCPPGFHHKNIKKQDGRNFDIWNESQYVLALLNKFDLWTEPCPTYFSWWTVCQT